MRERAPSGGGGSSMTALAAVVVHEDASPPESGRRRQTGIGIGARRSWFKTPVPFTGTVKRMKHLPYIKHVVHQKKKRQGGHSDDGEEPEEDRHPEDRPSAVDEGFGPVYTNVLGQEHDRPEGAVLRCVYNYEDRYRFSRILSNETLCFDSHFESGNLRLAYRVVGSEDKGGLQEYDLILHNDLHSKGHVQWYYFCVSNMSAGQSVVLNILNFSKQDSLYTQGMRPLLFSQAAAVSRGQGWARCGSNIRYYPTNTKYFSRLLGEGGQAWSIGLHTLSFTLTFESASDVCFLAYCYPYTYTDLYRHLDRLQSRQMHQALAERCLRRTLLCKSLAGNHCDLLVITSPCRRLEKLHKRQAVILTGRVHPGESNASFVMKGVIDFLVSNHPKAKALRDRYVFKVVPMLNPDGVVNGNYRTSLAGADLNRRWDNPHPTLHPTIASAKHMIESTLRTRPIALMVDLHGHSRRQGVFMYACIPEPPSNSHLNNGPDPMSQPSWPMHDHQHAPHHHWRPTCPEDIAEQVRLFPSSMSEHCPSFSASNCRSTMPASKASTMRIVLYTTQHVYNAYTLETSLAGADGRHFTPVDLENVGVDLCLSILTFRRRLRTLHHSQQHDLRQRLNVHVGPVPLDDVAPPTTVSPAPTVVSLANTFDSSLGFWDSPPRHEKTDAPPSAPPAPVPSPSLVPQLLSPYLPLTPRRIYHLPFGPTASPTDAQEPPPAVPEQQESSGSDSDPSGDNLDDTELAQDMQRAGLVCVAPGLLQRSPGHAKLPGSDAEAQEQQEEREARRRERRKHRRHQRSKQSEVPGVEPSDGPPMSDGDAVQPSPNKRYNTEGPRHVRPSGHAPESYGPVQVNDANALAHKMTLTPRRPPPPSPGAAPSQAPDVKPSPKLPIPSSVPAAAITIPSPLPLAAVTTPSSSSSSLRRTLSEPGSIQENIVHQWRQAINTQHDQDINKAPPVGPSPAPWTRSTASSHNRRRSVTTSNRPPVTNSYWERQQPFLRLSQPDEPPPPTSSSTPRDLQSRPPPSRPEVEDDPIPTSRRYAPSSSTLPSPAAGHKLPPAPVRGPPSLTPRQSSGTAAPPILPSHHPNDRRAIRPRVKPPHIAAGGTRKKGPAAVTPVSQRAVAERSGRREAGGLLIIKPAA